MNYDQIKVLAKERGQRVTLSKQRVAAATDAGQRELFEGEDI